MNCKDRIEKVSDIACYIPEFEPESKAEIFRVQAAAKQEGTFMGQTAPHIIQGTSTFRLNSSMSYYDGMTILEKEYWEFVKKFKDIWNSTHPETPIVEVKDLEYKILTREIKIKN